MHQDAIVASMPWYRTLNREQWRVLAASNLAWLFDGFEIYALFLTVGFALHQLLVPAEYAALPRYAGYVLATTVFGWATGGVIGGIIADYIGRKRTMMLAILAYSLTTGLSAVAWNWQSFAILRFLVGVGIGSEWATGASIVSELWPDHARGKGGGLLQSGAGIGSFLASGVWLLIGGLGPNSWRFMYLVGILPALLVLWIWRGMPELARWEDANERRREARAQQRSGVALDGEAAALTRFTVTDMFLDRTVRPRLIAAFLMMLSVTFGFWGVATFVPTYVGTVAARAGLSAPYYSALAGLLGTGVCDLRLYHPRFPCRRDRPQANRDAVLPDVPDPDPGRLSVGERNGPVARRGHGFRLFHRRHLGLGADLAARAVPDPDARHGGRVLLQRAALDFVHRAADRRHLDRGARRLRPGGDDCRSVFHPRRRRRAVPARDQRPAAAARRVTAPDRLYGAGKVRTMTVPARKSCKVRRRRLNSATSRISEQVIPTVT